MQTYLVGGAVRDALMGLPVRDRDWVVVGSTAQAMVDAGFVPVGRDFPVFYTPAAKKNMRLRAPSEKPHRATGALPSTLTPPSRWKKIWRVATSASTP